MKMVIDTNIFVSAFAYESRNLERLVLLAPDRFEVVMTDYIFGETLRVTNEKRPPAVSEVLAYLESASLTWFEIPFTFVRTVHISDPKDQPILDAAIACNADVIISGDKDFLRLDIDHPRIMRPADFIAEFMTPDN